jgi:hypothetical protein
MRCRYCAEHIEGTGIKAGPDDDVDDMHNFCDLTCLQEYILYLQDWDRQNMGEQ